MKEMTGVELTCREVKNGRIYPTPSYTPSIYRVMLLDDGTFRVTDVITLKDRDGRPLNGMPNPLRTATTETPLDGAGKPLQQDLRGIDAEDWWFCPTARSGSARKTRHRWRISEPTGG
jgi:hypothetical protein